MLLILEIVLIILIIMYINQNMGNEQINDNDIRHTTLVDDFMTPILVNSLDYTVK